MLSADLQELHAALAVGPRTTAQLAIDCKWSLDDVFKGMKELERQGLVARVSDRAVNSHAVKWQLVSAAAPAEPEAPAAPGWAASADAPSSAPRTTKRAAPLGDDVNPFEAPSQPAANAAEHDALAEKQKQFEAKGNFWLGFVAGIFVGPIAYLLTTSSAPQTNRGASWGAAAQFTFFVGWRLLLG